MIIRKDDLESAVEHGVISARDAQALSDFTIKRSATPRAVNEQFRLVSNFSEVFICIGLFIVYGAFSSFRSMGLIGAEFAPLGAIGFWLLAEFFAFRTNKMLPALVSVLMFCYIAVQSVLYFTQTDGSLMWNLTNREAAHIWIGIAIAFALSFARFRIPILLAPFAVSSTLAVLTNSGTSVNDASFLWPIGICGVAFLALAIWFDSRDPLRRSRQNAYAFWLFIVGSPLAVHPIFASVWLQGDKEGPAVIIAVIVSMSVLVTIIGLILDRRSLVASTLVYFTGGIGYSYFSVTNDIGSALATTSLLVGFFVILLGVLWYRVRTIILSIIPFGKLVAIVPPSK